MEAKLRTPTHTPAKEGKFREENPAKKFEGREMLVGEGMETEEARNDFIDSVENLLEFKSLEEGRQHSQKNFDYAAEHSEMFELVER